MTPQITLLTNRLNTGKCKNPYAIKAKIEKLIKQAETKQRKLKHDQWLAQ